MNQTELECYSLRLADDALIYAQRLSQWCSRGPTLEEDLALTNVALDYLGRARFFYQYAGSLSGHSEDHYAFERHVREFANLLLVELPNGDFAQTMVRQYFLDEFGQLFLAALSQSSDAQLAAIADKAVKETAYHLRRSRQWMLRFGLGTAESHSRASSALQGLWGYVDELFVMDDLESHLLERGVAVDRCALQQPWREAVSQTLAAGSLSVPTLQWQVSGGRLGLHTEHMNPLLAQMQSVQRAYPGLQW
jgi:ring-1,2-phenylacetyl-CoA epoxidase subunit PaaC